MRYLKNQNCNNCPIACDIYLTAVEMGLADKLTTEHIIYCKKEPVCRQNTLVTHAVTLVDGSAKMFIEGIGKRDLVLNILLPSNYIGLLAVYGIHTYPYSVTALSDCHVCLVDINLTKEMYGNNRNFMLKVNQAFGGSVTNMMQKLVSMNQKQIRGKVAESLLYLSNLYENNQFELIITRKELGELSALSEENAVRVLTEFKKEDYIDIKGKMIVLKDTGALSKISAIG